MARFAPAGTPLCLVAIVVSSSLFAIACRHDSSNPTAPSQVTSTEAPGNKPTSPQAGVSHGSAASPSSGEMFPNVIGFPPRDQPNAFFQDLIALYRDVLRRTQSSLTYVDSEGENVWLTEYFRFYLNGCPHQEAMIRTLRE